MLTSSVRAQTLTAASALLLLATVLPAQSLQHRTDSLFARFHDAPGCTVEVRRGEELLARGAYGLAELEFRTPINAETIIEAGSVSKQFTAAAILLLEARGLLSLDDEVQRWFPEVPQYERPITLRHLMSHTSGLRDWGAIAALAGWPRTSRAHDHDDALAIIARQRGLNHRPGEQFSYTNSGYNLMAILVERVTGGMSMAEFTRREFFEPLGMTHTSWRDDFTRVVPGRAQAYFQLRGEWHLVMPFENVHGNGGLLTTVGDLLTWTDALADGRLGRPNVGTKMMEMVPLNDGSPSGYGGGLFLNPVRGVAAVRHTGATAGYRAVLSWWPEQDIRSAILCNRGDAGAGGMELTLLEPVLPFRRNQVGSAGASGDNPSIESPSVEDLAAFTGKYRSDEVDATWTISLVSGQLRLQRRPGGPAAPLRATGPDQFEGPGGAPHLFNRDASGRVVGLRVSISRALNVPFQRVE